MPSSITIDNTSKSLPADEFQAQKVAAYNAVFIALEAAWTSWTPTWTNLSVGNGTVTAKFRQIGKTVFCRLILVWGSTTSISGSVSFTIPVTRAANAGTAATHQQGNATFYDSSATTTYGGSTVNTSTTTSGLNALDASGATVKLIVISSTVPFTWTTSDEIHAEFIYEAA